MMRAGDPAPSPDPKKPVEEKKVASVAPPGAPPPAASSSATSSVSPPPVASSSSSSSPPPAPSSPPPAHGGDDEEEKEEKEVKAEAKEAESKKNATATAIESLQKSIATMIMQARDAEAERVAAVEAARTAGRSEPQALGVTDPLLMYGYDAKEGALKKWVGSLKKIDDEIVREWKNELKTLQDARDAEINASDAAVDVRMAQEKKHIDEHKNQQIEAETKNIGIAQASVVEQEQKVDELSEQLATGKEESLRLAKSHQIALESYNKIAEQINETERKDQESKRLQQAREDGLAKLKATELELKAKVEQLKVGPGADESKELKRAATELGAVQDELKRNIEETERKGEESKGLQQAWEQELTNLKAAEVELKQQLEQLKDELEVKKPAELVQKAIELSDAKRELEQRQSAAAITQQAAEDKMAELETEAQQAAALADERGRSEKEREGKRIDQEYKAKTEYKEATRKIAAVDDTVKKLEQEIRSIQNSWMRGQPIDPEAMKEKVNAFRAEAKALAEQEPPLIEEKELKKINDVLDTFAKTVDKEIVSLKKRAEEQVITNRISMMDRDIVSQRVFYEKLNEKGKEKGKCDLLRQDAAPTEDKIDSLLSSGAKRAYVVVDEENGPQSLYFINKATKECYQVCEPDSNEMKAVLREMQAGDALSKWSRGWQKVAHPLATRPLHSPSEDKALTTKQEERLKELSRHSRRPEYIKASEQRALKRWEETIDIHSYNPFKKTKTVGDWKEIIPIAIHGEFDLANEREKRADEEEIDPIMARDHAIERLREQQKRPGGCEYDYSGERFKLSSSTDEKGRMLFQVTYSDSFYRSDNVPNAMAKMISLCHFSNPTAAIELSCERVDELHHAIRIAKEVEYAIIAAEKARKEGIFIGIKLDKNVLSALRAVGANDKNLLARANTLYDDWEKHSQEKLKKEESVALKNVEKTDLGKLLESKMSHDGAVMGHREDLAELLQGKDTAQKVSELDAEVAKLEARANQFDIQNTNIKNQLTSIEEKIRPGGDLAALEKQLEDLEATQGAANAELLVLAGPNGNDGVAGNYAEWIHSVAMKEELGITGEIEQKYMDAHQPVEESDAHPDINPYIANLKRADRAEKVQDKARGKYQDATKTAGVDNNLSVIGELREKITSLKARLTAEAKAAADAKAAEEAKTAAAVANANPNAAPASPRRMSSP